MRRPRGALRLWQQVVDGLLGVVWAPRCAACDALLAEPTRGAVCQRCWHRATASTIPSEHIPGLHLFSVGRYEDTLRSIIHAFKYDGRRSLGRPLAALMRNAGVDLLATADFVVPVPLHWRKQWQRGFNQADDLARHLGPPVLNALRRVRATPSQASLSARRRHRNVKNAFALAASEQSRGVHVPREALGRLVDGTTDAVRDRVLVVVDDVYTTGATLSACARILLDAGADDVAGLTIAATPRAAPHPPRLRRPPARRQS